MNARSKASWDRFRKAVEAVGGTVVEAGWLGSSKPHRARCSQGHDCAPYPNHVARGVGICAECAGNGPATGKARFEARVSELGGRVLGAYTGSGSPVHVRCANGHDCYPRPNNLHRGDGICRQCVFRNPGQLAGDFEAAVVRAGGSVRGEVLDAKTPVHVVCPVGHDGYPTPDNVLRGQGVCARCTGAVHDVFYVVAGAGLVKFGITSGDSRPRLGKHRADGLTQVLFLREGLSDGVARSLELTTMNALNLAGHQPVRGREYFPVGCTDLILALASAALPV